jgi:dienelactone hydrolase
MQNTKPLMDATRPLNEQTIVLPNGIEGELVLLNSATPRNYEDIVLGEFGPPVQLHANLFLPKGDGPFPAVTIIPGSGGVNPWMIHHAHALTEHGIAALVVDPFTARNVVNTIAVQQQFSFAASTWDVFTATRYLQKHAHIKANRVGALGYSRGAISVIQSTMKPLADVGLKGLEPLAAVHAGWPWCGFQFKEPRTTDTAIRMLGADKDQWVSVVQAQAYFNAISCRNKKTSFKLVKDAQHGFGYGNPHREFPDAMKALLAPICYFNDAGQFLDVWTEQPVANAEDSYIVKQLETYISRGVTIGTQGTQMPDFIEDFCQFFKENL